MNIVWLIIPVIFSLNPQQICNVPSLLDLNYVFIQKFHTSLKLFINFYYLLTYQTYSHVNENNFLPVIKIKTREEQRH